MPRNPVLPNGLRLALPGALAALTLLWAAAPSPGAGASGEASARSSEVSAPDRFFGVSGRRLNGSDPLRMAKAGVGTYRTLFHFHSAKRKQDGFYYWRELDRIVRRTAANGIDLLPLLYGTPPWVGEEGTQLPIHDPEAELEWQRLLRALVNRYGPGGMFWKLNPLLAKRPITAWQIWNEPNDGGPWGPAVAPAHYARLLAISAEAIRAVDPGATIVAAGVVAKPFGHGIDGDEYLRELASIPVARRAADRFAFHPYGRTARAVRRHLWRARRALREAGAPAHRIWVTEVGWGSDHGIGRLLTKRSEGAQARALEVTFRTLLERRARLGIDRVLWYYWRDHHDPFCLWCRSAGLLHHSYRPKPAFATFRAIARG